jgi:hypothetical protein
VASKITLFWGDGAAAPFLTFFWAVSASACMREEKNFMGLNALILNMMQVI